MSVSPLAANGERITRPAQPGFQSGATLLSEFTASIIRIASKCAGGRVAPERFPAMQAQIVLGKQHCAMRKLLCFARAPGRSDSL